MGGPAVHLNTTKGQRDGQYIPRRVHDLTAEQYREECERWAQSLPDVTVRALAYEYFQGGEGEDLYDAAQEFKRRWPGSNYGRKLDRRRKLEEAPRERQPIAPEGTVIVLCEAHLAFPEHPGIGSCKECVRVAPSVRPLGSAIASAPPIDARDDDEAIRDAPKLLPEAIIDLIDDAIARDL